jgi:phospholipid/cholesterol/gamma-HCH transport system substrate-binding protein
MNSKDFFTPFKVGLLVIVGIAATIFMLTRLTYDGGGDGATEYIKVYALFDDATGLAVRSRIRTAGIVVGEIESIERQGTKARIEMKVNRDLALKQGVPPAEEGGVWKNGATVARKSASVIGDYFLEVTPGTEGDSIPDQGRIYNVNGGTNLEEVFATLDRITKDIEEVTNSLANVLGGEDGQKGLEQILRDLQTTLREIADFVVTGTDQLDKILVDGKAISSNVRELAVNTNQSFEEILFETKVVVRDAKAITRNVRDIVGQSSGDVQAGLGSLSGTLIRLQSTLDSLNYSLQNIQDITDKINEGEGTVGALVNDPAIAEKTDAILGDAQEITGSIGRLQTIMELRFEYHPIHGRFKNVIGLRLQPKRNKYYLLEVVDDFRFDSSYTTEAVIDANGNEQQRQIVRTTKDDIRFSLQYALGWNFLDDWILFGRFGLIESTGGIGGTLDKPFSRGRRLRVHVDLFDFDIEGVYNPRVRVWGDYHFADHFRVMAGLDDIFNEPPAFGANQQTLEQNFTGFSPFLSLGFIFTDEDLKGLLTATGIPAVP